MEWTDPLTGDSVSLFSETIDISAGINRVRHPRSRRILFTMLISVIFQLNIFFLESYTIARELFHLFLGLQETLSKAKTLYRSATKAIQIWLSVVCEKYARRCEENKTSRFFPVCLTCTCESKSN